ncbi:MAG: hypothetical protein IPG96_14540 [Proteobacteria bacterium]|nr:hypothetical protein [Pseudomonadota bacterium]
MKEERQRRSEEVALPDIPRPVLRILQRALAHSPEARYATAAGFADDLRGYLSRAHPRYERQQLARLMSDLFAREIAESQRRLNDFVLGQADPEALLAFRAPCPPRHRALTRVDLRRASTRVRDSAGRGRG